MEDAKTGVEMFTESDKCIHLRGPLFAEIFKHYDKIEMTIESIDNTGTGLKASKRSDDPYVAKPI